MLAPFNWSTYNTRVPSTTTKPSPSQSVELPFYFLCRLFNDLEIAEQCTAKTIRYSKTEFAFTKWLDAVRKTSRERVRAVDILPLIFPEEDISRKYSLKEAALVPLLAHALGLTGTTRGRLLSEWRIPTPTNGIPCDLAGNLGSVVEWVVRASDRAQVSGLTVREVNVALTELASHSGFSDLEGHGKGPQPSGRTKAQILTELYSQMSSLEAKWITRIILKNMSPLRLSVWVFLRIYHPMMPAVYHMHTDLKIACERIEEVIARGVDSRTEAGRADFAAEFLKPVVGVNVEIMPCEKGRSAEHVREVLGAGQCFAELKYDGERMQIHFDASQPSDRQITVFSKSKRNSTRDRAGTWRIIKSALGHDPSFVRSVFAASPSSSSSLGTFATNYHEEDPRPPVRDCILEAELLVYNEAEGRIEEFGSVRELQEAEGGSGERVKLGARHFLLVFFDILYLDGKSLMGRTYGERRQALEAVVRVVPNYSMLAERVEIDFRHENGVQRLCDHFSHVTATLREEGLVVKRTDSTYNPGRWKRDGRGACWVKMKRDYIKGLGDTADFVVVGARYRPPVPGDMLKVPPGTLNQFYIGCLENKEDVVRWDARPKFRILFTVQHGLSAKMLQALNVRLAGRTVRFEFEENPVLPYSHTYAVSALLEPRRPDVLLLEPFVVELLGSGFVRVSKYAQYYVLRFPRVTRVQEERKWKTEGVGFGELQEMAKRVMRVGDEGKSDVEEQEEFEVIGEQKGRISKRKEVEEERGEREKRRRLETKMIPKGAATQSTESSSLSTYGSIPLHAFASSANEVEPQPTGVHSPPPSSTPPPPSFSRSSSLPSSPSPPPSPSLLFFPPTCIYHIIPSSHAAATRESMGRLGVQERNVVYTVDAVAEWVIGGDKGDRVGVVVVDRRRETVWRKVRAYVEAKVAQSGRTDHASRKPGNAIRLLDRKVFNALIASCGERSGSGDCDSGSETRRREQMASRVIMAYELAAVNVVRG